MNEKKYIKEFEEKGFGMFVHFGLYSIVGKGEWYKAMYNIPMQNYKKLVDKFNVSSTWAKDLIKIAKSAGCKYITLTTRHHDGFSLFDTKGLNNYDAIHSKTNRDLVKEFVDQCNHENITPFFYHTLLDWENESYKRNFKDYLVYLRKSIEILCTNYGKIGGFWFDGMWDKPNEDWEEDKLYSLIRKYQPEAMIINNTGLSELGKVGHPEIDSVTFERGNPTFVDNSDKHRAGEMCQILNDHWGYAKNDCNYKSIKELIENLVECRKYNCNFLLNVGLKGNGKMQSIDKEIFLQLAKWVNINGECIYNVKNSGIKINQERDFILKCNNNILFYVCFDLPMSADPNVTRGNSKENKIQFSLDKKIKKIKWLDGGIIKFNQNDSVVSFSPQPFPYGKSLTVRVAKIELE